MLFLCSSENMHVASVCLGFYLAFANQHIEIHTVGKSFAVKLFRFIVLFLIYYPALTVSFTPSPLGVKTLGMTSSASLTSSV